MTYQLKPLYDLDVILCCTMGSWLYGTQVPTSDYDYKAIVLPSKRNLLLARPLKVQRCRYDADGNKWPDDVTMPPNGYELERTPVQKFVHDYLGGQAYAVEFVYAVLADKHDEHLRAKRKYLLEQVSLSISEKINSRSLSLIELCSRLASEFKTKNVNGMIGFAVKQTFDYVRRGERLNAAKHLLSVLQKTLKFHLADGSSKEYLIRLDTPIAYMKKGVLVTETLLDEVTRETLLEVGSTENNGRTMRTLKLNGREYLETTTIPHLISTVEKLVDSYGERSTRASETEVDWKSLSHAVRVYQQVIELLEHGTITFPRPNVSELVAIKTGQTPIEEVKEQLCALDDRVTELLEKTTLPEVSDELRARCDDMLYSWLENVY